MRPAEPAASVARLAELLREGGLLSAEALRTALERWQHDPANGPDVARFARWLVVHGYLSEAQLEALVGRALPAPRRPVLVARPAAPRADRADVPVATPAAPGPEITVELVPAAPPEITVELVPSEPLPAAPTAPPEAELPAPEFAIDLDARVVAPPRPSARAANVWLFLLLGAAGLLAAQLAGWTAGYLAHVLLFGR